MSAPQFIVAMWMTFNVVGNILTVVILKRQNISADKAISNLINVLLLLLMLIWGGFWHIQPPQPSYI